MDTNKKDEYEIDGFGTVTATSDGLFFRLEVDGQVYNFLISHERTIEAYMSSTEKILKSMGIGKENRAKILRGLAATMPVLANNEVVKQKYYVPFWPGKDVCYEAIRVMGRDVFLYYSDGKYAFADYIDTDYARVHPIQYIKPYEFTDTPEKPSLLTKQPLSTKQVFDMVHKIVSDYYFYPDPRFYKFMSLFIMHTYILAKSIGTIFIWLIGAKRSGKTTIQTVSEMLGYRPFSGVDPSEPTIYRTLGWEVEYAPLIIIREFEEANDIMRMIAREGDIPGATVPRVDKEYEKMVVRNFHIFGGRIVASNKLHGNEADSDRYMYVRSVHGKPKKPRSQLYRDKAVIQLLNDTRNELLLWRVANYSTFAVPDEDAEIKEGRDWEHFGGIITLAKMVSPELEQEMRGFVKEYLKEKDEESNNGTISVITNTILSLAKENEYRLGDSVRIPFDRIWSELKNIFPAYVDKDGSRSDTKLMGDDNRAISTNWVGKLIKEQLFGHPKRWGSGPDTKRGYIWLQSDLEALSATLATGATLNTALPAEKNAIFGDGGKKDIVNETKDGKKDGAKNDDKNDVQTPLKSVASVASVAPNAELLKARTIDTYLAINSPDQEERQLGGYRVYRKDIAGTEKKLYSCMKCGFTTIAIDEALKHKEVCK